MIFFRFRSRHFKVILSLTIFLWTGTFQSVFAGQSCTKTNHIPSESNNFPSQARKALSNVFPSRINPIRDIPRFNRILSDLTKNLQECGVITVTNSRLEGPFSYKFEHVIAATPKEDNSTFIQFYKILQKNEQSEYQATGLMLATEFELSLKSNEHSLLIKRGIVFAAKSKSSKKDLAKTYKSQKKHLLELLFPSSELEFALDELAKTENFRTLYHLSENLLNILQSAEFNEPLPSESTDLSRHIKAALDAVLRRNTPLIVNSESPTYQRAFLNLLEKYFPESNELLLDLSEIFLHSHDQNLSQLSALTQALHGSRTDLITSKIRDALKNTDPELRKKAVLSLDATQDLNEQNLLIGMVDDPEFVVSKAAFQILNRLPLNSDHLEAIKTLYLSQTWNVRHKALSLIGNIVTLESTNLLVTALRDPDHDVSLLAIELLKNRELTEAALPGLKLFAALKISQRRIIAADFISKISTSEARNFLTSMLTDPDAEVSQHVAKLLGHINLI